MIEDWDSNPFRLKIMIYLASQTLSISIFSLFFWKVTQLLELAPSFLSLSYLYLPSKIFPLDKSYLIKRSVSELMLLCTIFPTNTRIDFIKCITWKQTNKRIYSQAFLEVWIQSREKIYKGFESNMIVQLPSILIENEYCYSWQLYLTVWFLVALIFESWTCSLLSPYNISTIYSVSTSHSRNNFSFFFFKWPHPMPTISLMLPTSTISEDLPKVHNLWDQKKREQGKVSLTIKLYFYPSNERCSTLIQAQALSSYIA